jgi:chromosome segregation protein
VLDAAAEEAATALAAAEEAMQGWQQRWDEFNHRAAEPRQQAEVQQSRIQHLEHALKRLQARMEQLAGEQRELAPAEGEEDPAPLREELAEAELAIAGYEEQGEALAGDLAASREQGTQIARELDAARSELAQLRGRQASLEALQQAAAEDASGGADAWLDGNGLAAAPRLLSQLDVAAPWQRAVETVLGDYLHAVCVDDLDSLGRRLDGLAAGHLTLVARASMPAAPAGTLAAEVNCGGRVAGLLSAVRTAADEGEALALRGQLAGHESVITPDGLWLGPNWLSLRRGEAEGDGVIRRQQELEALSASVASTAERVRGLETAQAAESGRLRDLEQARQALQREQQAASRRQADAAAQLKAQEARVEQLEARRAALARDAEDARAQFEGEQASIAEARQVLAEAIERMESDAGERETLLSERDRLRGELDGCRQAARQARDSAHQAAMRLRSLQTQVETIRSSIARTEAQVAQLSERRAGLASGLEESSTPVAGLEVELETQLQLRSAAEAELTEARQRVAEVEHALRSDEQARAAIEQRVATARAELEQCRLGRQTLQVQRENVGRQLKELSRDPAAVLEGLPEEATREGWQQQLERVATRIARLGPINLAAIDEYSQQSERKQYLDAQNEDLESALGTLESAIRKIDRETRSRFQATFDKVNSGLQELFPRVFGGGNAYLEMTGDDLLDTGISIMARPPGKKNSTIHLLSGGEKALTAIALVFSIFQLNPAPFCMLDEVDAPLDDANVGRYARMVKEMSEKVQFIFITHNKITMELADQLLGVTMHEPGVSRLVAVDVEEAAELAAS